MRAPELVVSTEPTPDDVQYLEDRLYEFNSAATGITDGEWLAIFVRDDDHRIVAGICGKYVGRLGGNSPVLGGGGPAQAGLGDEAA